MTIKPYDPKHEDDVRVFIRNTKLRPTISNQRPADARRTTQSSRVIQQPPGRPNRRPAQERGE